MLEITTLCSGSGGNSTLIRTEKTAVLIDAGRSHKALKDSLSSLGMSFSDISGIFITHEHTDHISALDIISKNYNIPIYITKPSSSALTPCAADNARICSASGFSADIGDLSLVSFPLPHDSAAHVGYRITSSDGDTAGVATDMGFFSKRTFDDLCGCRQIVIEANHDKKMLMCGAYPHHLKQRILSRTGHLSNTECAEACVGLAENGCGKIMLAHLSRENNTPSLARKTVEERLLENGFFDIILKTAPETEPLTL